MDEVMGEEAWEITEKDRDSHQRIKEVCQGSPTFQKLLEGLLNLDDTICRIYTHSRASLLRILIMRKHSSMSLR
jgi:hypothetical protein